MEESFLHFIWKYKLFDQNNLKTLEQESLEIINTGNHNHDSGPDFENSKLKIGETIWAGNVEVHVKSSDWEKHHHTNDAAYKNVILHAVYEYDKPIFRQNGEEIPVLILNFDKSIFEKYTYLQIAKDSIACSSYLEKVDSFFINNWMDRLGVERLEKKSSEIKHRWEHNNKDIEQTFYEQLAISFGLKTNAPPFEELAMKLPIKTLMHHNDSLFQIESLLFGVAGLLEEKQNEDYQDRLRLEFNHLKNKFTLRQLNAHQWKFLRMRPQNFPTIRLAQFAAVIMDYHALFSKIIDIQQPVYLEQLFNKSASEFWETHYTFEKKSPKQQKNIGKATWSNIAINTVAPFLFFYGNIKKQQAYKDKAVNLLQEIKSESNKITTLWNKQGIKAKDAFESQALIQLFNEYCMPRKCLDCQIGCFIIAKLNG